MRRYAEEDGWEEGRRKDREGKKGCKGGLCRILLPLWRLVCLASLVLSYLEVKDGETANGGRLPKGVECPCKRFGAKTKRKKWSPPSRKQAPSQRATQNRREECWGSLKCSRVGVKTLFAPLWAFVKTTWERKMRLSLALFVLLIWMPDLAMGQCQEIF